jgi:hypothetical protein
MLASRCHWRIDQILTSDLFGLPSARDASLDTRLAERDRLLAKAALTPHDERRLAELRAELGALPGGDSPWEMRAMEVIRRAAVSLEAEGRAPTPCVSRRRPTRRRPPRAARRSRGAARKRPRMGGA